MMRMMANKQTNTRIKHLKKICFSHININSIRNKLDSLLEFTYDLVNFLAVNLTKLVLSQKDSLTYQDLEHYIDKMYRGSVGDYFFM